MAVPKKKTSYQKSRSRRMANMKLKPTNFYIDDLGNPCLPHRINSNNMYKGRKVFSDKEVPNNQEDEDNSSSAIDYIPSN